ncbi:hypothetical protein DSO57_1029649 [Entomophthora muscae]|uniref:Uncharacterized protein n=1 Tax=Entomophthora muscae TaxID=34485 RepID=A0ACC2S389_9FUNG|nr:hypothetical protein DSO57_1029649 [Entomophthora muscae]
MKLFHLVSAVLTFSLVDQRLEEAERKIHAGRLSPFSDENQNIIASYEVGGRVAPGAMPQISSICSWIHGKGPPQTDHPLCHRSLICKRKKTGDRDIKICCLRGNESFWWGDNSVSQEIDMPKAPIENIINAIIPQVKKGFFWFKPLLWSVSAHCFSISLTKETSTTKFYNITNLYPLKSRKGVEGIFGLQLL